MFSKNSGLRKVLSLGGEDRISLPMSVDTIQDALNEFVCIRYSMCPSLLVCVCVCGCMQSFHGLIKHSLMLNLSVLRIKELI